MKNQGTIKAPRAWLTACACVVVALLGGCKLSGPTTGTAASGNTSGSQSTNQISGGPQSNRQTGSITLSWLPPTQNTDGSALTNLAGYYIDYGTQSHHYTHRVTVANAGISSYVVDNLQPGTYYFAVQAYGSSGAVSAPSQQVSAVVN